MPRHEDDEDLKSARGTLRGDRQSKVVSMAPLQKTVRTPKGLLTRRAKFEYSRCLKHLASDGLAAEVDKSLLIAYCNEIASYFNLAKEVAETEKIVADMEVNASTIAKYKALLVQIDMQGNQRDKALKNSMNLGAMFGLTPAARGKIKVGKKKEKKDETASEFDKLMSA